MTATDKLRHHRIQYLVGPLKMTTRDIVRVLTKGKSAVKPPVKPCNSFDAGKLLPETLLALTKRRKWINHLHRELEMGFQDIALIFCLSRQRVEQILKGE